MAGLKYDHSTFSREVQKYKPLQRCNAFYFFTVLRAQRNIPTFMPKHTDFLGETRHVSLGKSQRAFLRVFFGDLFAYVSLSYYLCT